MKVKAGDYIRNFPPRLKEAALANTRKYRPRMDDVSTYLDSPAHMAFDFGTTPENADFWWAVHNGLEIDDKWGETTVGLNYEIF